MNRSILIVICDFLLVSLLLFSSPDPDLSKNLNNEGAAPQAKLEVTTATNQPDGGKDLAAVMKLALAEEQKNRELLLGDSDRRFRRRSGCAGAPTHYRSSRPGP